MKKKATIFSIFFNDKAILKEVTDNRKDAKWELSAERKLSLTIKELERILAQAELFHEQTTIGATRVVTRLSNILTLISTLLLASLGFVLSQLTCYESTSLSSTIFYAMVMLSSYLLVHAFLLIHYLRGYDYAVNGQQPNHLMIDEYFNKNSQDREKAILIRAIDYYQKYSTSNIVINRWRWRHYRLSVKLLIIIPTLIVVYSLLKYYICN